MSRRLSITARNFSFERCGSNAKIVKADKNADRHSEILLECMSVQTCMKYVPRSKTLPRAILFNHNQSINVTDFLFFQQDKSSSTPL